MTKWFRGFRTDQRGQALVELALIIPVIMLILFGIIEFGRVFNTYLVVTNAAREGARVGVVGADDTQIRNSVATAAQSLNTAQITTTITPGFSLRVRGGSLTVQVSYPVRIYAPIIQEFTGDPYVVTASSVMRIE